METPKVFESEYRFCEILWQHEPVSSSELVKLCEAELKWKKSTTYTVIKRLAERRVLKSENAIVTSIVSKEEIQLSEGREFLLNRFEGSLPKFIAAFAKERALTKKEADEIRRMIDEFEEESK